MSEIASSTHGLKGLPVKNCWHFHLILLCSLWFHLFSKKCLIVFCQVHSHSFYLNLNQEIIRLMREKRFPAAFKCYHNFHKVDAISSDNVFYKMVIHVHSDSAFRRYQKEMRSIFNMIFPLNNPACLIS